MQLLFVDENCVLNTESDNSRVLSSIDGINSHLEVGLLNIDFEEIKPVLVLYQVKTVLPPTGV